MLKAVRFFPERFVFRGDWQQLKYHRLPTKTSFFMLMHTHTRTESLLSCCVLVSHFALSLSPQQVLIEVVYTTFRPPAAR